MHVIYACQGREAIRWRIDERYVIVMTKISSRETAALREAPGILSADLPTRTSTRLSKKPLLTELDKVSNAAKAARIKEEKETAAKKAKTAKDAHDKDKCSRMAEQEKARAKIAADTTTYRNMGVFDKFRKWQSVNPEHAIEINIDLDEIEAKSKEAVKTALSQAQRTPKSSVPKAVREKIHQDRYFIDLGNIKDALLDKLVGQQRTKNLIRDLFLTLLMREKDRRLPGYRQVAHNPAAALKHLGFYGESGTGKTKAAKIVGLLYFLFGIVTSPVVYLVKAKDLIAGWIGQTELKVEEILAALGNGVLIVDEAQGLKGKDGYEKNVITTIMSEMEKETSPAVFWCGYPKGLLMTLYEHDQGLRRRIYRMIECVELTLDDLADVLKIMVADTNFEMDCSKKQLKEYLEAAYSEELRMTENAGVCLQAMRNLETQRAVHYSGPGEMDTLLNDPCRRYKYGKDEVKRAFASTDKTESVSNLYNIHVRDKCPSSTKRCADKDVALDPSSAAAKRPRLMLKQARGARSTDFP